MLAAFCLGSDSVDAQSGSGNLPEKITVQLKWRHQFQFAGYYAAVEKGFYRDAGLEVALREGSPEINSSDEVLAGRAQYGISDPVLIIERNQGRPLVVLAAVFQHSPLALFSLKHSGISSPHDLVGRHVWMRPALEAGLVAMFRNEGISLDKISVSPAFHDVRDLIEGRIDAIAGYVTDRPFELEKRGLPYTAIHPQTYGIDLYGDCLFATEQEIRKNPERVRALLSASMKGWQYAMRHQEEVADIILKAYPTRMSREQLLFEARAMEKLIMPEFIELGHMNPGRWRHIGEVYVKAGMLSAEFSLEGLLYDPRAEQYGTIIRRVTYSVGLVAVLVMAGIVIMALFNRRLKFSVAQRTVELEHETAVRRCAEESLRASEAKYREIVEHAGSIILRFDRQGKITFFNEFALRFFGYCAGEILGKNVVGTIVPKTDSSGRDLAGMFRHLIQEPENFINNENENICRDGSRVWIAWTNKPVCDAAGRIVEILSIGNDITDRKRAEEQLRKELDCSAVLVSLYEKAAALTDRELYEYALDNAVRLTDSAVGFLHLVSPDQQNITLGVWNREAINNCTASFEMHYPFAMAGNWVDCVRLKQPVIYNDYLHAPNRKGLPEGHVPVDRFMSIPVIVDGRAEIVFGVGNKAVDYDERDGLHIQFVANELQKILLQRRSEAALQKANKAYRALSACNEAVVRATDEPALLQEAVRIIQQDCGYRLVWIGYAEHDEAKTVRPVAQAGYEDGYLETVRISWADTDRGSGPTGPAMRAGVFCVSNDVHTDPLFAPWREEALLRGYGSVACFPLCSGDEVLGALTVYAETPAAFADEELQLMMKLADSLAYGIISLRMSIKRKQAEEALRESEERFRKLAESAPIAIMIYQNNRWVYVNQAGEAMCGYTAQELYGMSPWDFVHPDYQDLVRTRAQQRMQGKSVISRYEIKIITKTGDVGWVDFTGALIEYNGAPAGIIAVIDITEREKTEHALRESESLIRSMFEADPTGIALTIDRVFRKANKRFCEIAGYPEEELIGQSGRMLYADEEEFNRVAIELTKDLYERSTATTETHWKRKDGSSIDILLSISPLNPLDWSSGFTTTAVDITERRQAEEALRASEALVRSMFETDPTGVALTAHRVFKKANRRFCEITGYPEEELIGQSTHKLYADEDEYNRVGRELYKNLQAQGIGSLESRWKRKNGETIDVLLSISPLNPQDLSAGLTSVVIDITDRKRMESALEKRIIALTRPLDEGAGIDFELLFNLEDIQKLQDMFARATGVASIITHVDGTPITRPSDFCRLCNEIIRKTDKGLANCYASDAAIGRHHPDGPIVQTCLSGGLWDAGASITVGGRHIANWLIGQVRNDAQDEVRIRQYAREIGADEKIFMQAFYEVPSMSQERFNEIAQALHTLAGQLSSMAYQNVQQARFICDLTRAEDSLRESREELFNIINNSVDGIYLYDETGKIVEWNRGCEQITQLGRDETLGKMVWDIYYAILPDEAKSPAMQEQMELLTRDSLKPGRRPNTFTEFMIQCADRTRKLIQSSDFLIKTAKGYMRCVISRDVTEIQQAAQEQLRLATAIEQADETVVITDHGGTIQYVNPAFERITGYTRQEAVGQNPRILKSGRQSEAFYEELWGAVAGGKTWKGHFINKKKDGSLFEEEATISPVKSATGEIINYVAVKRDVTQQLLLEDQVRQTQKLEALGTLAGGIAHDFNNILAGIMGYTELAIGEPPASTRIGKYLHEALNSAERARNLVKQILTFSRKVDQERKPVRVALVIKEVCKLLRASLPATIELRQVIQEQETLVMGDPTQIYQIVMNLCTNAHHAMRKTGGVLEIGLCKVDLADEDLQQYPGLHKGAHLKLTVSDTGCGIRQEHLKKIFDPYFTTKEIGEGTGLGLAVVDGIVKSHGGAIKVFSTEGEETTFEMLFPALLPEQSPQPDAEAAAPLTQGRETILFVDDEEALRDTAGQMLQQLGYRVVLASDAREGFEKFLSMQNSIDLVLTDKTMPLMTGFELARFIKELRPDMPFVLFTGHADTEDMAMAEAIGITQFVMKPLRKQALAETVRRALDRRKI